MSKKLCVGIDISKLTLDAIATLDGTQYSKPINVSNKKEGFLKLVKWIDEIKESDELHVCFESTGCYSMDLFLYLNESTCWTVSLMNPMQIKSFAKSTLLRTYFWQSEDTARNQNSDTANSVPPASRSRRHWQNACAETCGIHYAQYYIYSIAQPHQRDADSNLQRAG